MDLTYATAVELVEALRAGALSSRELLDHTLARIDEHNPALNAVVTLDNGGARAEAERADRELAAGRPLGPLHGLVVTVKDVWETAGMRTTSGAPALADHVPQADALAVARLRAAGAVIVGKTNTPLYAGDMQTFNEVFGRTNNPWDLERTAGGSSGGSAAAVAAGLTPLELGSDIGGSIRAPAHYCGVHGLKPSWGVVPSRGHIPGPPGNLIETDVNAGGPLARSVGDLRLALDVLAGPVPEDAVGWSLQLPDAPPTLEPSDLHLAVSFDDPDFPVASEVRAALRALVADLTDAGARVDEVPPPVSIAEGVDTWSRLVLPIIGKDLPDDAYDAFTAFDPDDADPTARSAAHLAMRYCDWSRADQRRQEQRARWAACFDRYDAFLLPIQPVAAFPHDTHRSIAERTVDVDGRAIRGVDLTAWPGAVGAMLLPAVVVPAGRTPSGLPVGVQVVGPYLHDRRLLGVAELVDRIGPGFTRPPGF